METKGIINGINTAEYLPVVRSNARLVDLGRKKLEACPSKQHVEICVTLIADYSWTLGGTGDKVIPSDYHDIVNQEIGLV